MLRAEGLSKSYGGAAALQDVTFEVGQGEVVGLIGENGAGKSTMIKIIAGLVRADSGQVFVDQKPVRFASPMEAARQGISFIHQERNVLDNLDIAGNVLLGAEPTRFGFLLDRREMRQRAKAAMAQMSLTLSPDDSAQHLSNAQRQMVEIARALSFNARLIIMDEPTSSLSAGETEKLLHLILELKAKGVSTVYVSHRLDEIKQVADRVVGLRDGKNAGSLARDEVNSQAMVRLMVGRDLDRKRPEPVAPGEVRLTVRNLKTTKYPRHSVSFEVRSGEVVGIAGPVGAGRTEIARAIFGIDQPVSGEILIDGHRLEPGSPQSAIDQGVFLAPEDRRREGAILGMSIGRNITLPAMTRFLRLGLIQPRNEREYAQKMKTRLGVKTDNIDLPLSSLSGGNQQKVVLAKWLGMSPKCLVLDEPTVGIDVGARAEIYKLIRDLTAEGVAILMMSSDMEEILQLSDRVLVMHEGNLSGELTGEQITEKEIMNMAVGHAESA